MSTKFQINDPSLESQWRAIILFGKNSATYKFAFAKVIIVLLSPGRSSLLLEELAVPFARNIVEHLRKSDKQGVMLPEISYEDHLNEEKVSGNSNSRKPIFLEIKIC